MARRTVTSLSGRLAVVVPVGRREQYGWIVTASDQAILAWARRAMHIVAPRLRIPEWVGEHRVPQRFAETMQTQELAFD